MKVKGSSGEGIPARALFLSRRSLGEGGREIGRVPLALHRATSVDLDAVGGDLHAIEMPAIAPSLLVPRHLAVVREVQVAEVELAVGVVAELHVADGDHPHEVLERQPDTLVDERSWRADDVELARYLAPPVGEVHVPTWRRNRRLAHVVFPQARQRAGLGMGVIAPRSPA